MTARRRFVAAGVRSGAGLRILPAMSWRSLQMAVKDSFRRKLLAGALAVPAAASAVPAAVPTALLSIFGGPSGQIEGSGKVIDEPRRVTGFNRLIVQGPIDVRLHSGDAQQVVVHADDNIAPLIETKLEGEALVVGLRAGASYRTRTSIYVKLQSREMRSVVLRGSGEVRADRIDTEVFEATIQGSGDIRIETVQAEVVAVSIAGNGDFRAAGTATSVGVVIDGAGDVYCDKLQAKVVAVRIRGSGDARVHAGDELKVHIDGSGDVRYRGEPRVTRQITGSGSVKPLR